MRNLFYALSCLAIVSMYSCSSNDDLDIATVNPTVEGLQFDVASASELASYVTNFKAGMGTRAVATGIPDLGVITSMPEAPSIPSNIKSFSEGVTWGTVNEDCVLNSGEDYTGGLGLNGHTIYIAGNATINNAWGSGVVYVMPGGTLTIAHDGPMFNNGGATIYNYGNVTTTKDYLYVGSNERFYSSVGLDLGTKSFKIQGDAYIGGDLKADAFTFERGNHLYVSGDLESATDLKMDGNIQIKGGLTAPSIYMESACHLVVECAVNTPGEFRIDSNEARGYFDYLECGSMYQCASSEVNLVDGGMINCAGTYVNVNNGTSASISVIGDKSTAVVKAAKMVWNAGGNLNKCYIFRTPGQGSQIALDCPSFNRLGNGNAEVPMDYDEFDFTGGNVVNVNVETNRNAVSIPQTACNPGYNFTPEDPNDKHTDIIAEINHSHDISATGIQSFNGKQYACYHQRGREQSGCVEVMKVANDQLTLLQFVRDHNRELDYNHLAIDNIANRLYLVGNSSKKGAVLAFIDLTNEGLMNTEDSVSETSTGRPLRLLELQAGNRGDGNCVLRNGDYIQVASTFGLETYDANTLNLITAVEKPGKAKHLAINGNTLVSTNLTNRVDNEEAAVGIVANVYAVNDYGFANPSANIELGQVQPNNGKNVTAIDGNNIYTCLGAEGFKCFGTDGTEKWSFIPKHAVTSSGKVNALCNGCAYDDQYIYLAYGSLGLIVVDKNTHKEVARRTVARSANYVTVSDGYIFVAYGQSGLEIFKLAE
jgi:hypothetical protein